MWDSDIFNNARKAASEGLGAIVQAKAAEVVARSDRKSDMLRETVRGATVSPVNTNTVRENSPFDTAENGGLPTWAKTAAMIAAVIGAAVVLRRL